MLDLRKTTFGIVASAAMISGTLLNAQTSGDDAKVFDYLSGKLDKGGSFYSISNTTYAFNSIARAYADLETQIAMMPLPIETKGQFALGMLVVKNAVQGLGLNEVKALAGSSVIVEPNTDSGFPLFRNRYFVYHGDNNANGLLWGLAGNSQPLNDIYALPANTVLAASWQVQPTMCWNKIKEVSVSAPPVQMMLLMAETSFMQKEQTPLNTLLDSVSGQWLTVVTEEKTADGKAYLQAMLSIPSRDGAVFNLMKKHLAGNPQLTFGEKEITVSPGAGFPQWVAPVIRQNGDRLLIVSNPAIIPLVEKATAAKDGWVKTADYQRLSKDLPKEGSGFLYVSRRYAGAYGEMMKNITPDMGVNFSAGAKDCFMVFAREKDGISFTMNANLDLNEIEMAKFNVVAVPIVAGMMLPAINSGREKSRRIECASNLKQIGLALKQYALDNKNNFPAGDNVAGLGELVKKGYLSDLKTFTCPSDDNITPGNVLSDENCSYVYLGGFSESPDYADCPLAFDIPGSHDGTLNVLYADGHVSSIDGKDVNTCVDLINRLNESNNYKPEVLKKLLDAATRVDAQLGLGEE